MPKINKINKMNKMNKNFIKYAIDKSLQQVYKYGRRSPNRVKYIHYWIRNYVQNRLGNNYRCYSYNPLSVKDNKEIKVAGKFYSKNSDITICNNEEKILGVISVKFILSNYKQNSNNYFESMIGECYNLKANGIKYGHIIICPLNIPYYDINSKLKKIETLKSNDIMKYTELNNSNIVNKPDMLSFNILDIKTDEGVIPNPDLFKKLNAQKQDNILDNIKNKCELLNDQKINKTFDFTTSQYLVNNSIIKSLNNYMDTIEKDYTQYQSVNTNNNNNNILDTRYNKRKKTSKNNINHSLFEKLIKKIKK